MTGKELIEAMENETPTWLKVLGPIAFGIATSLGGFLFAHTQSPAHPVAETQINELRKDAAYTEQILREMNSKLSRIETDVAVLKERISE